MADPNIPEPVHDTEMGVNVACLFLFVLLPHVMVFMVSLWDGTLSKREDSHPWPTGPAKALVSQINHRKFSFPTIKDLKARHPKESEKFLELGTLMRRGADL